MRKEERELALLPTQFKVPGSQKFIDISTLDETDPEVYNTVYYKEHPIVTGDMDETVIKLLSLEVIFMARRKDSPQKAAMREMMRDYLKNNDISIKDGTDVNSIMRDMMSVILEGALDEELDEELGYSKYDYRTKKQTIVEMDIPAKPCTPVMEIWVITNHS